MAVSGTYVSTQFDMLYNSGAYRNIYAKVEFDKGEIDTYASGSLGSNPVFSASSITGSNDGTVTIYGYPRKSSGSSTATLTTRWYVVDSGVREYVTVRQNVTITVYATGTTPTVNITLKDSPQYYLGSNVQLIESASVSSPATLYVGLGSSTTTEPTSWTSIYRSIFASSAGTYYIWYKVIGSGMYLDVSPTYVGSVSVLAQKMNPTVTILGEENLIYNGSAQSLISSATVSSGCTLYVSLSSSTGWTTDYRSLKATNVGDYNIYYKVTGNSSYNDIGSTYATTVRIHAQGEIKQDPTVTITLNTSAFIQSASSVARLITYASVSSGCTIYFGTSFSSSTPPGTWYSDYTSVTADRAVTYYVWYKVTGNSTYNDISQRSYGSVTVGDASTALIGTYPTTLQFVYDNPSRHLQFATIDGNITATATGSGSFTVSNSYGNSVIDFTISGPTSNALGAGYTIGTIRHGTVTSKRQTITASDKSTSSTYANDRLSIRGDFDVKEGNTYTFTNSIYSAVKDTSYKSKNVLWSVAGEASEFISIDSPVSSSVEISFPIGTAGKTLILYALHMGTKSNTSETNLEPSTVGVWTSACSDSIVLTIQSAIEEVTIPTWKGNIPYTGSAISVNSGTYWNNYPTEGVTVTGFTGTNAGTYSATFTCSDGYEFSDGTTEKTISWGISKATNSLIITSPLNQEWVSGSTYDPIRYVKESGTTFPLIVSSTFGSITYSSSSVNASVTSGGVVTSQDRDGIAVITLSVEGTNNYYGVSGQIQFEFQNNPVTQIMYQHHWNTAEAYVYLDGMWRKAIPYIWYDGSWRKC